MAMDFQELPVTTPTEEKVMFPDVEWPAAMAFQELLIKAPTQGEIMFPDVDWPAALSQYSPLTTLADRAEFFKTKLPGAAHLYASYIVCTRSSPSSAAALEELRVLNTAILEAQPRTSPGADAKIAYQTPASFRHFHQFLIANSEFLTLAHWDEVVRTTKVHGGAKMVVPLQHLYVSVGIIEQHTGGTVIPDDERDGEPRGWETIYNPVRIMPESNILYRIFGLPSPPWPQEGQPARTTPEKGFTFRDPLGDAEQILAARPIDFRHGRESIVAVSPLKQRTMVPYWCPTIYVKQKWQPLTQGIMTYALSREQHLALARRLRLVEMSQGAGFIAAQTTHSALACCLQNAFRMAYDNDTDADAFVDMPYVPMFDAAARAADGLYWTDRKDRFIHHFVDGGDAAADFASLSLNEFMKKQVATLAHETMATAPPGQPSHFSLYGKMDWPHPDESAQVLFKEAFGVHVELLKQRLAELRGGAGVIVIVVCGMCRRWARQDFLGLNEMS